MTPPEELEYEKLVEDALRGVVRAALRQVAKHGLPGAHHFYLTFRTDFDGVKLPDYLRQKYPGEMTIVLQHQFYDLEVVEEYFEVTLSFNSAPERLHIPFAAITGFADPAVKFGLQFHSPEGFEEMEDDIPEGEDLPPLTKEGKAAKDAAKGDGNNVVTLDQFRKK
ncbi:MAG: SspB family protein [Dongiaceae bacterium]